MLISDGLDRVECAATLPLKLDTTGRLLLIDPYWLQWRTTTSGGLYAPPQESPVIETLRGAGCALTFANPLGRLWKMAAVGIVRYHWLEGTRNGAMQPGGVVLLSRVIKPTLTMRLGTYVNHDAFGVFVMPLAGIDWRIDVKTNLYGVLPGSMTLERKSMPWFHWGVSFRAYTTSFGERDGNYRRINENPLGLYGDLYVSKTLVLRTEVGWCFMRNVLGGPGDRLRSNASLQQRGYADHGIPDAPYARLLLAYRLRLDTPR